MRVTGTHFRLHFARFGSLRRYAQAAAARIDREWDYQPWHDP